MIPCRSFRWWRDVVEMVAITVALFPAIGIVYVIARLLAGTWEWGR